MKDSAGTSSTNVTMPHRPILLLMLAIGGISLFGAGITMPLDQPARAAVSAR